MATAASSCWEEEREARIAALLAEMTRDEKIMQIGQVDKAYLKEFEDIGELGIGSIISGGSSQVRAQPVSQAVRQSVSQSINFVPRPLPNDDDFTI